MKRVQSPIDRRYAHRRLEHCALLSVLLGTACTAGVADDGTSGTEDDVVMSEQGLWRSGETFPGRAVTVCWENAVTHTTSQTFWPTFGPRVRAAAVRSWTQATGLRLDGWDMCPPDDHGMIKVGLVASGGSSTATVGYVPEGGTYMQLDVSRGDFDPVAMHEFGHALGFAHEMERQGFQNSATCTAQPAVAGDAENTPQDDDSIMAATGYCQNNLKLSAWDIVGAQNAYGRPNYFADVNADGKADAIVINPDSIYVRLSNGSNFSSGSSAADWTAGAYYGEKGTFFADVTGDGRADAIVVNSYGIVVRPSNGSSFPSNGQAGWTEVAYWGDRGTFFADVTGDGRADAIAVNADGIYVRNSDGSKFPANTQKKWASTYLGSLGNFFADVNNDSRADAIAVNSTGVTVRLSTGSSFAAATTWSSVPYFGDFGTFFADVNGDGRADAIVVNYGSTVVRLSNGSTFDSNQVWSSTFWGERGTMFADVNGGGRADAIAVAESGVTVRLSSGTKFASSSSYWTGSAYYSVR